MVLGHSNDFKKHTRKRKLWKYFKKEESLVLVYNRRFISRGADINNKSGRFETTPLITACFKGHPLIVQLFVKY